MIEKNMNYKEDVPGLFNRTPIENVDWYGLQRILLYCIVREIKPEVILETGVYYGGNSVFILGALEKNNKGKLIAIDYPQNRMNEAALKLRHPWVCSGVHSGPNLSSNMPVLPCFQFSFIPFVLLRKSLNSNPTFNE